MKKWKVFCIFLIVTVVLCGCGIQNSNSNREKEIAIRIASENRMDSLAYQQLQMFASQLQETSHNHILAKIYCEGQWSNSDQFTEYLRLSSIQMAAVPISVIKTLAPEFEVFEQPCLFAGTQELEHYIQSDAAEQALAMMPKEYVALGFVPDGYAYYTVGEYTGWLPYGEIRKLGAQRALSQTTVYDGKDMYSLQVLLVDGKWWKKLTEERQNMIRECYRNSLTEFFRQQEEKPPTETLRDMGIQIVDGAGIDSSVLRASLEMYFATHPNQITYHWRPFVAPEQTEGDAENER